MIRLFIMPGLFTVVLAHCFAQNTLTALVDESLASNERMPIVQASIGLTESNEQIFLQIYEDYQQKYEAAFGCVFTDLHDLFTSAFEKSATDEATLVGNYGTHMVELVALKEVFFKELCRNTNGDVGLQFLQTEELIDLMLTSELFKKINTSFAYLHFDSLLAEKKLPEKRSAVASIFSIEDDDKFWFDYDRYEMNDDRYYTDPVSLWDEDYTLPPAQAQKTGEEFLKKRRLSVESKENYYQLLHKTKGPAFAARFIVVDNFYDVLEGLKRIDQER